MMTGFEGIYMYLILAWGSIVFYATAKFVLYAMNEMDKKKEKK